MCVLTLFSENLRAPISQNKELQKLYLKFFLVVGLDKKKFMKESLANFESFQNFFSEKRLQKFKPDILQKHHFPWHDLIFAWDIETIQFDSSTIDDFKAQDPTKVHNNAILVIKFAMQEGDEVMTRHWNATF